MKPILPAGKEGYASCDAIPPGLRRGAGEIDAPSEMDFVHLIQSSADLQTISSTTSLSDLF